MYTCAPVCFLWKFSPNIILLFSHWRGRTLLLLLMACCCSCCSSLVAWVRSERERNDTVSYALQAAMPKSHG
ncbi:hypothetical protein B0F90DRAFT_1749816 [Multifurca ochricompacta]|uniref:Uncharacterized protein n=1 Tax=Multifurca ochricompacta TaxID=376703 RepID=A0AAD4LZ11_9AGAM|nr:hypothetical protein B0F90DRAFT_1749816 [Multifurca ochricompacta]